MADDINLFKELGQVGSPPKTTVELATSTGTDPALLCRILRHLAALGIIAELGGDGNSYCATEVSATFATTEGSSGIRHLSHLYTPVFQHVPDYLKSINYVVPKDIRNGPFQQTLGKPGECNTGLQIPGPYRRGIDNIMLKAPTGLSPKPSIKRRLKIDRPKLLRMASAARE